jgi:Deoxyribonuclease II
MEPPRDPRRRCARGLHACAAILLTVLAGCTYQVAYAQSPQRPPLPLLERGHPVDWWFVFKLNSEMFQSCGDDRSCRFGGVVQQYTSFGLQFAYASNEDPTLRRGAGCAGNGLNDPVGATFDEVYNGSYYYAIWNDQFYNDPPINGCGAICGSPWGHSKGVVAWNDTGEGFVMQASTPDWPASGSTRFPRKTDGNTLGCLKDNDILNSQHFFALKLTKNDLVQVLQALANASVVTDPNNPQIVHNGGPADVQSLVSRLGTQSTGEAYAKATLSTGVELISKASGLHVPPWQMVSAVLGGIPLRTATWWARPQIPTTTRSDSVGCWSNSLGKPGPVEIATTGLWAGKEFALIGGAGTNYNHAKLGVSISPNNHYAIFGDLNQQGSLSDKCGSSQNGRGGLFYVVNNAALSASVKDLITAKPPPQSQTSENGQQPVPKAHWFDTGWNWIKKSPIWSSAILVSLLLLMLAPSRLVSELLAQDVLVVNKLAPWFYLTGFGQRKLFKRYRDEVAKSPDVRDHAARYVDLPYECNGAESDLRLSAAIKDRLLKRCSVEVIAEGGRGKTSLCCYLTAELIKDGSSRRVQPVMVDGLDYNGNLLDLIVSTLKRSRAYVNPTIVESQLSMGHLLIMFDGMSEIREAFRSSAEMSDIPAFIRKHPDTPFIFTSRSSLPGPVGQALKDRVSIKLKDVDSATLKEFLSQYLKNKSAEADTVAGEIEACLGDMPKIPLMLKLVAAVYDQTGRVPKDRSNLLSQYSDYLLRPDSTGIGDAAGLRFALRHLVRETHVKSGGDRGFTVDDGVRLLGSIRDDLANYNIRLSPIELISLLGRAGLFRRTMDYCRFFHDSFESYFAALSLLADFHNRQYANLPECKGNPRLKEAWDFFLNMLDPSEELPRLAKALSVETGSVGSST